MFIYKSYKVIETLGAISLAVILLSITAGIISRYVFNSPFTWTEELCTVLMVYLCYFSAALTTVAKEHVVADFILNKMPVNFRKILSIVVRLMEIIFLAVTAYSCIKLLPSLIWKSSVLHIPRTAYYAPIIVMSIFMGITIAVDLLNDSFPGYDIFQQKYEEEQAQIKNAEQAAEEELLEKVDSFIEKAKR